MKTVSTIIAAAKYMPEKIKTSQELEKDLNFDTLGVRKNTIKLINGVITRHIASDNESSSDLAAKAAIKAIEMADIEAEDLDLILFCSVTQDFIEPATAYVIQKKIDASNASCFDIKNACNAFITGMEVADIYIKAGKAKTVLVVSGEKMSHYVKQKYKTKDEVNATNATLGFGDAGAAVIFSSTTLNDDDEYSGAESRLASYGEYWDKGVIWGGGTRETLEENKFYMKNIDPVMIRESSARAVFYFYDCMKDTGVDIDSTDFFVTSQMSKYAVLNFAEAMKIPNNKITTQCSETGNVGASNIGVGLAMQIESGRIKLHSGQRLVFMGAGNGLSLGYFTIKLL